TSATPYRPSSAQRSGTERAVQPAGLFSERPACALRCRTPPSAVNRFWAHWRSQKIRCCRAEIGRKSRSAYGIASGPVDPALDGHACGEVRVVDRQLVVGEGSRRAVVAAGLPGKRLHSGLRLADDAGEELVGASVAQGALVAEGDAGDGPHVGPRGRLVELEHLVEGALQQREVIIGETGAVGSGREVGVDVAVNAVEGIGDGELAAHGAVAALLLLGFFFSRHGAASDGVLVSYDGMERSRQAELHGAAHLAAVDVGRHDGAEGSHIEEVLAHPCRERACLLLIPGELLFLL